MIEKAKTIALHSLRYGEKSLIAYVYTLEFGRLTLMVNSAYGKGKSPKKAIFFQPLSLLNTIFYKGKSNTMCRLKEVELYENLNTLFTNPVKRAIALFMGEVIYRTVREEESNPKLFTFLESSIQTLNILTDGVSNFHLLFLAKLSQFLGFYPYGKYSSDTPFFDFKTGLFVKHQPDHPLFFQKEFSSILSVALQLDYGQADEIHLNGSQRSTFLEKMISFYSYHMESVQGIKSLPVLSQVFDE